MKKLITAILTLFISFAATAQEGPSRYWTLGGSLMTFDDGFDSIKPIQIFGRIGYDFNANFGVGLEGGFSLIKDELAGVDWDVTATFLYLRGILPIGEDGKLYAMIGPTNVELTGTAGGISMSVDDDDTGIGFGYEKALGNYSLSVDYIIYNDNSGAEVNALNLGFVRQF